MPSAEVARESAASAARRYGERALHAQQQIHTAPNRRERLRHLYEAKRLRAQAEACALMSPDYQALLVELARILDEDGLRPTVRSMV